MKFKTMVLVLLICVVTLFALHEISWAKQNAKQETSERLKVGTISVRTIFEGCKKNKKYMKEAIAERGRLEAELEKLDKEIEADKAGLKTLKQASTDYMESAKEILQKQAYLQAQQEFYKRQIEFKDQQWTEKLYQDILRVVNKVAKQKGLDLVFEKSEPEFPVPSSSELMLAIRTHKLVYSGQSPDISAEVIAQLDAND